MSSDRFARKPAWPHRSWKAQLEKLEDRVAPGETLGGLLTWSAWLGPYVGLLRPDAATSSVDLALVPAAAGDDTGPGQAWDITAGRSADRVGLDAWTDTTPAATACRPKAESDEAPAPAASGWLAADTTSANAPSLLPWEFWAQPEARADNAPAPAPTGGANLALSTPAPSSPDRSAVPANGRASESSAVSAGAAGGAERAARNTNDGSAPAAAYLLTGPAGGDVDTPSAPFTISAGGTLQAPVTITLSDGNTGGSFSVQSVMLTNASPTATFTYTPSLYGQHVITAWNNSGRPPVAITYFANVQQGLGGSLGGLNLVQGGSDWYRDISNDPVDPNSAAYVNAIGASVPLRFAVGQGYGMPYNVVAGNTQPLVPVHFWPKSTSTAFYPPSYPGQSDPNTAAGDVAGVYPYHLPIPANAQIEQNSDHHVLILDRDHLVLWELWEANPDNAYQWTTWQGKTIGANPWAGDGGWTVSNVARWDLKSTSFDSQRPLGWTSADAAGLSLLMGTPRYDEVVERAVINHAIRFTAPATSMGMDFPARHAAGSSNMALPPMGLRVRLKANVDLSRFSGPSLVVMQALKKYGMVLADNGPAWETAADIDPRWGNSSKLGTLANQIYWSLHTLVGSDFEVVQVQPGYTLSGPGTATVGQPVIFTLTLAANVQNFGNDIQFVMLSDNGAGGTFQGVYGNAHPYLQFDANHPRTLTFTYIPRQSGMLSISTANHSNFCGDLIDPQGTQFAAQ